MDSIRAGILQKRLTPRLTKYCLKVEPTPKQTAFLLLDEVEEALYGGAAGGGKTIALALGALQFVDVPGYSALLLRRTFVDLSRPKCLIPILEWLLKDTDARWVAKKSAWVFPSSATVTFGHCDKKGDERNYKGGEYQYIAFDESTEFFEEQYDFIHTRLRRTEEMKAMGVPLRMRCASNPGGPGHKWNKIRFIEPATRGNRIFIPAKLYENPYLDRESYARTLDSVHPLLREQMLNGNWDAAVEGRVLMREWFRITDKLPFKMRKVRFWDKAATEGGGDWTVGVLMGEFEGKYYILDIQRAQYAPASVQNMILQTAQMDGIGTVIFIEEEPGSSGKESSETYRRLLRGFAFHPIRTTGDKVVHATPFANAAQSGRISLYSPPIDEGTPAYWIPSFLTEAALFPTEGVKDDQIDAASGAYIQLSLGTGGFNVPLDDISPRPTHIPGLGSKANFDDLERTIPKL